MDNESFNFLDLSAFDGRVLAYHAVTGNRELMSRFWKGSLRNGHHVSERQQACKVKCVRISPAVHRDLENFQ